MYRRNCFDILDGDEDAGNSVKKEMKKFRVIRFARRANTDGFTVQSDFFGVFLNGKLKAASSGWTCGGNVFVYTKESGQWRGGWYASYSVLGRLLSIVFNDNSEVSL